MTTKKQPNLALYEKMVGLPFGRWLFSKVVCFKAPYFSSIKPRIDILEPGRATVTIRKRRAVQNHIGTVHAIAMCNMAELAGGMMTDVTIPTSHRWIPKGLQAEYLQKATTGLTARASVETPEDWPDACELTARVDIYDDDDVVVSRFSIPMWVTAKGARTAPMPS
ncbi:MAG: hotdog fold domain-containing protein [Pseudomonadota bacterium]